MEDIEQLFGQEYPLKTMTASHLLIASLLGLILTFLIVSTFEVLYYPEQDKTWAETEQTVDVEKKNLKPFPYQLPNP